jgi:putative ABC transport system substrate-binding protein
MRRREFLSAFGGSVLAYPVSVRAQQASLTRRVGILIPYPDNDSEAQLRVQAFKQEMQRLGWNEGSTIQFDVRWTTDNMDRVRTNVTSLVDSKPDVILAQGGRLIPYLMEKTRSIPIVFPGIANPVGAGFVKSLARPGGNVTGFSLIEFSVIGKMLEMLKQIAPGISRVALIFNSDNPNTALFASAFERFAGPLGIKPIRFPIRTTAELESSLEKLVRETGGGVFFPPDVTITARRDTVIPLLARFRLPAIYSDFVLVRSGGLIGYSPDRREHFRSAASYVDRILRGEKPADLPVQQPTKYDLAINLRTARALDLTVPPVLLAVANEVIE